MRHGAAPVPSAGRAARSARRRAARARRPASAGTGGRAPGPVTCASMSRAAAHPARCTARSASPCGPQRRGLAQRERAAFVAGPGRRQAVEAPHGVDRAAEGQFGAGADEFGLGATYAVEQVRRTVGVPGRQFGHGEDKGGAVEALAARLFEQGAGPVAVFREGRQGAPQQLFGQGQAAEEREGGEVADRVPAAMRRPRRRGGCAGPPGVPGRWRPRRRAGPRPARRRVPVPRRASAGP